MYITESRTDVGAQGGIILNYVLQSLEQSCDWVGSIRWPDGTSQVDQMGQVGQMADMAQMDQVGKMYCWAWMDYLFSVHQIDGLEGLHGFAMFGAKAPTIAQMGCVRLPCKRVRGVGWIRRVVGSDGLCGFGGLPRSLSWTDWVDYMHWAAEVGLKVR